MNPPNVRILLIDDDRVDRRAVRRLIGERYDITEAENARTAFELLSREAFDCVLLDYRLPDATGVEVLDQLATSNGASSLPVVMLTGSGGEQIAVNAMKSGAADYLSKDTLDAYLLEHAIEYAIYRKTTEDQLARYTTDLERANSEMKQFVHTVSHDLKEPLWSIRLFARRLREKYRSHLDAEGSTQLDFIVDSAETMSQLITDLLAYARLDDDSTLPTGKVDLSVVFERVQRNLTGVLEDVDLDVEEPLPIVPGNESLLMLLFQNLVSNGAKFRGERRPHLEVTTEEEEKSWVIHVRDNGIGIPKEAQYKIFQLFGRLHSSDIYPGTGLGLSLCKKIVNRHKGEIWVESVPGAGSTFSVRLPR